MKYKECAKHNKNLTESTKTVSTKTVSIVSKSLYLDYDNACTATATMNMSEEDKCEEALWYNVKVYKVGSVILVDSGAAFTSVNEFIELQNLKNIKVLD